MPTATLHPFERFMSFVEIPKQSGCWLWMAQTDKDGYGHFKYKGKDWLAHRFAYAYLIGVVVKPLTLDHLCRRPVCVNPFHLEKLTPRDHSIRTYQHRKIAKAEGK